MNSPSEVSIACTINGAPCTTNVEPRELLSDFLRHDRHLTGTHVGCEHGVCGACTVLVDGRAVRSCLTLAVQVDGAAIETVESLAPEGELNALQQSMRDEHGLQCGFCTPGILMSLVAAEREGMPADEATTEVLGGHICRCTGYQNIRKAIEAHWSTIAGGAS